MTDTRINIGDEIEIVTKYNSPLLANVFKDIPTTRTHRGVVLAREAYDPLDSLRMTSDDPMVDLRVVSFKNILLWNGEPFRYTSHDIKKERMPEFVMISGSKGAQYRLTIAPDGGKTCSCPGFGFRGRCKHVDEYNEQLKASV